MPCPTCDHTVAAISVAGGVQVFQCERCGTAIVHDRNSLEKPAVYVPKLVARCRELLASYERGEQGYVVFEPLQRFGIVESIHRPEDRPQQGVTPDV